MEENEVVKFDLGCGTRKQQGFIGIDARPFDGVDYVCNLADTPWSMYAAEDVRRLDGDTDTINTKTISDESVDEIFCSHFAEHLTGEERVSLFNECYRVLKFGGKMTIIVPDWSNDCAYGDPTHKWPPFSRWSALYLNEPWRRVNAPHVDYTCDFDFAIGGSCEDWLNTRVSEARQFNTQHYTNALRDLHITLTKTKR